MSRIIKLYNSSIEVIIDDEDYAKVSKQSWCLHHRVVVTKINANDVSLASFILDIKTNHYILIDHKDRDIFNNQKENLRIATQAQNNINKTKQKNNTSGYKGVCWHKNRQKWMAQISIRGIKKNLGYYFTKTQAAKAYNKAALKYYGEFAYLNEL